MMNKMTETLWNKRSCVTVRSLTIHDALGMACTLNLVA